MGSMGATSPSIGVALLLSVHNKQICSQDAESQCHPRGSQVVRSLQFIHYLRNCYKRLSQMDLLEVG